jgi:CRP/FNR family transcriptional regulator
MIEPGGRAMMIEKMVAPLQRVAPFQGLKPEQLEEIARNAERVSFRPGDFITRAGEPGRGAYLIVSGVAGHTAGSDSAVPPLIETGSLISELAMLVEHHYAATITARDRVLCLLITRAALYAQMLRDPPLADHFVHYLTQKLARVAEELRAIDKLLPPRHQVTADHAQPKSALAGPSARPRDTRPQRLAG